MPRYGEKSTCYCGREIRWTGKWWEHTEGVFRHIAEPGGPTPVAGDEAIVPAVDAEGDTHPAPEPIS